MPNRPLQAVRQTDLLQAIAARGKSFRKIAVQNYQQDVAIPPLTAPVLPVGSPAAVASPKVAEPEAVEPEAVALEVVVPVVVAATGPAAVEAAPAVPVQPTKKRTRRRARKSPETKNEV